GRFADRPRGDGARLAHRRLPGRRAAGAGRGVPLGWPPIPCHRLQPRRSPDLRQHADARRGHPGRAGGLSSLPGRVVADGGESNRGPGHGPRAARHLRLGYLVGTHSELFVGSHTDDDAGHHGPARGPARAVGTLLAASVGAAWIGEVLVGAAEATGHALGMSPVFLGIVLLAVIGGAIALFVTPVLVLLSGLVGPTTPGLALNRPEVGALLIATLIVVTTSNDGRATWFNGVQLLAVYLVIAASVYWMPVAAP